MQITNLTTNPNKDQNITITFNSKITILLGKNGDGKTTLLRSIGDNTEDEYYSFFVEASQDINKNASMHLAFDPTHLSNMFTSEGERKIYSIGSALGKIGSAVAKSEKELIILLDEVDSGLSPDRLKEFADFFSEVLAKEDKVKKIFIAANSYELASLFKGKADFLWVETQEFVEVTTYEKFIEMYFGE